MFGAMFRRSLKQSPPPTNFGRPNRTRLEIEVLESRDVPSTVVYSNTFDWNGVADVTVTVTEDAPGHEGQYLWNYHVTNESFAAGIAKFALPAEDSSMVSGLGNSVNWNGSVGTFLSHSDLIAWESASASRFGSSVPLAIGQSADFWFTTADTAGIGLTNGLVGPFTGIDLQASPAGFLAVPLVAGAGLPTAPLPALLVSTETDKNTPTAGLTSLREAIGTANTTTIPAGQQQEIRFSTKVAEEGQINLNPAQGQLVLEKNIFINGPADNLIIARDADSPIKHRIFDVKSTSTSTLSHLYLYDGKVANEAGGGIRSSGNLTLINCRVYHCEATNSLGGGIAAQGGSLTVTSSRIDYNTATQGGGIYIGQQVTTTISGQGSLSDMEVRNNYARHGGGIYIESSATQAPTNVTLSNVSVANNEADEKGGGIMVSASSGVGTWLTLLSTNVSSNTVLSQNPAVGKGGGLYFGRGLLTLGGAFFNANTALTGAQAYRVMTGTTLVLIPFTNNQYEEVVGN